VNCRWIPLIAALALAAYAMTLPPRVQFVRPPGVVSEGDHVQLQIRVEPDAMNRLLVVELGDDGGTVRRSDEQLPGADAPRTRWLRWLVPRCEDGCLFVAALYGVGGQEIARATSPVRVQSVGP
jgi:hypothetical protein